MRRILDGLLSAAISTSLYVVAAIHLLGLPSSGDQRWEAAWILLANVAVINLVAAAAGRWLSDAVSSRRAASAPRAS